MRLYTRTGATTLNHPDFGEFEASDDGWFDLPDPLAEQLHGFHVNGQPAWETQLERHNRLLTEELERRKDPATLLSAVEQLVAAAGAVGQLTTPAEQPEQKPAAKRGPGRPRKSAQPTAE